MQPKDQQDPSSGVKDETQRILEWRYRERLTPGDEDILRHICAALAAKGYSPVRQLSHYLMTGDPTYITAHQQARALIGNLERHQILEAALSLYVDELFQEGSLPSRQE